MGLPRVDKHALPRPGLLAGFDHLPALTLVCGPIGSGKTTLVAEWVAGARSSGHEVLWSDGSVDRPATIVDALAGVAGIDIAAGMSPTDALAILTTRLRLLDGRIVLVIDAFDSLAAELGAPLMELLLRCRAVHLVICVRHPHNLVWQTLSSVDHQVVTMDDLAFTPEEVAAYANGIGAQVDDDSIAVILEATAGIAALVSAGFRARGSWSYDAVRGSVRDQVRRVVQPADVAGVSALAHLDGTGVDIVRAALGANHERLLEVVQTVGAVQRHRTSGKLYLTMPPVVGEALRSLHDPSRDAELAELHDRVIAQLESADRFVDAVNLARRTKRHDMLLSLVERHWWAIAAEDLGVLGSALQAIPEDLVARSSVLTRHLTKLIPDRVTEEPLDAIDSVPTDDEDLRTVAGGPGAGAYLDAIMIGLMAARFRGDQAGAREEVRRGMLMVTVMSRETRHKLPTGVRRFFVQAGLVHLLDDDLVEAELAFRRGYGLDEHDLPDVLRREAANKLAYVQAVRGDHMSAQAWLDRADAIKPPSGWLAPMIEAPRRLAMAMLALDRLDQDEVERQLDALSATITTDELWFTEVAVRSAASLVWGRRGNHLALHQIQLIRAERAHLLGEGSLAHSQLLAAEADLLISLGHGTKAQALISAPISKRSHPVETVRARMLALSGRPNEALAVIASVSQTAHGFSRARAEALLLTARIHRDLGQLEVARTYLTGASRHPEFVSCFASVPRELLTENVEAVPVLGPIIAELEAREVDSPYPDMLAVISLTDRERQLVELLPTTQSRDAIARSLFVSSNTVKTQLSTLYRKLGVASRDEAVARAYELGLLS